MEPCGACNGIDFFLGGGVLDDEMLVCVCFIFSAVTVVAQNKACADIEFTNPRIKHQKLITGFSVCPCLSCDCVFPM